jgi:integral membrane protein
LILIVIKIGEFMAQQSGIARLFKVCALIEAITWAGLLLGMYLKYGSGTTDQVVWWFGRLHGLAFLVYFVVAIVAAKRLRWQASDAWLAILAAIPPLVTWPLEIWFQRRGLLSGHVAQR